MRNDCDRQREQTQLQQIEWEDFSWNRINCLKISDRLEKKNTGFVLIFRITSVLIFSALEDCRKAVRQEEFFWDAGSGSMA